MAKEFHELQRSSETSKSCTDCIKRNQKCPHPLPTFIENCSELRRKAILKPLFIVVSLFFLSQFTGDFAMKPFMVQIFKAYESPMAPDRAAGVTSVIANAATLCFICSVPLSGKRRLYLFTIAGLFLSSLVISLYGFIYLPSGYNSFNQQNQSFHLTNPNLAYIPMICLFLSSFFTFCGFNGIAWMLASELFPFK